MDRIPPKCPVVRTAVAANFLGMATGANCAIGCAPHVPNVDFTDFPLTFPQLLQFPSIWFGSTSFRHQLFYNDTLYTRQAYCNPSANKTRAIDGTTEKIPHVIDG
jgi:hypothetical protein